MPRDARIPTDAETRPSPSGASPRHRSEHAGATLLVVLILTTLFAALSLSLLATTDTSVRARKNGLLLDRAERAAQSGVEWAAARIAASGEAAGITTVPLEPGLEARVQIVPGGSPNVISEGRCGGVAVAVRANVKGTPLPIAHNMASFVGTSQFVKAITSEGPVYLGDPAAPIDFPGSLTAQPALVITGDLDLVASPAIPAGFVNFQGGGQVNLGVVPIAAPGWDTSIFLGMTSGSVAVHHYSGTTWIWSQTLDGIVVFDVSPGDAVTIEDCTINGTVVIHAAHDPNPMTGTPPNTLSFKKTVTINGGTALTGNLAVLAPGCEVRFQQPQGIQLNGVAYVGTISAAKDLTVDGQLLVRGAIHNAHPCAVTVPNGFTPDVPLGIQWPASTSGLRIEWLGRL